MYEGVDRGCHRQKATQHGAEKAEITLFSEETFLHLYDDLSATKQRTATHDFLRLPLNVAYSGKPPAVRARLRPVVGLLELFVDRLLAELFHVVVSVSDALYLVFRGQAALAVVTTDFLLPVLAGNTIGGVVFVTLVNYGQADERLAVEDEGQPRLDLREWLVSSQKNR